MTMQSLGAMMLAVAVAALGPTVAGEWLTERAPRTSDHGAARDSRCSEADRVATMRLLPLLGRTTEADGYVVDRALHALDIARTHCRYGWVETGLGNYAWLERWIEAND